jgi:REP element-mobilizing transposase RayT
MAPDVANLRHRDMYLQFREATIVTAKREDFRIVHMSIQRNHVHLLVEADHKDALSRGMQGFSISAAKRVNATITARTGPAHRQGRRRSLSCAAVDLAPCGPPRAGLRPEQLPPSR